MKRLNILKLSGVFALITCLLFVVPNPSFAEESNNQNKLTKEDTQQVHAYGETFEVETWKDQDGTLYHSVPTDVKQPVKISKYVQEKFSNPGKDKDKNMPAKKLRDFSHLIENTDFSGHDSMAFSGSAYETFFTQTLSLNNGSIGGSYQGEGTADKIVLSYSYQFDASTITITYPPELKKSGKRVSWISEPVFNQKAVSATTHGATGESKVNLRSVDVTANADVYKGSRIYRPQASKYVPWGSQD